MTRTLLMKISVVAVLAAAACPVHALGPKDKARALWDRLMAPNPRLDSAWIYQPPKDWAVATGYERAETGVVIDTQLDFTDENARFQYDILMRLKDRAAHSLSLRGGYGPIQLGFSREVGRDPGEDHKVFALNLMSSNYALEVRRTRYSALLDGMLSVSIPEAADPTWIGEASVPIVSDEPGEMVMLVVDGIYAFNRKRFSYLSAYNGKMVQRRSAASWVVAARYMQGKLEVDPGDVTLRGLMVGTGSFSTLQGSLGGGFSANWVPWHRDPARPGDLRGLRNLTFNLTAMPMLAVYSRTVTRNDESSRKHVLASWMKPDFMTRAGVGFSAGHFFLNAWTDFSFHFFSNGQEEFETEDALRYTLSQGGAFSSWTAGLQLNWRF